MTLALERGDVLLLELPDRRPREFRGCTARVARVAHVTERHGGGYLVGCAFARPLSGAELTAISLRRPIPAA